ncbi:unnamed protein product [Staurois parvus]|uniref:Uncharacterized protein n=1 Tax=Staurois parvus TaxID=386267 RepID=A0ABN9H3V2_9NEOB|nr:unnamed protein product [Staurois parvus]
MALGRKELTCVAIKGLTVCSFTVCCVVLSTVSTLFCSVQELPVMLSNHLVPGSNHRLGPSD